MNARWVPPGWPAEVTPPGSPDWESSAVAWLFDVCPPDYRSHAVLRRHPVVLGWLAGLSAAAAVDATRTALARARADLREIVPPEVVEDAVAAVESELRQVSRAWRGVEVVAAALRGQRFVPRL